LSYLLPGKLDVPFAVLSSPALSPFIPLLHLRENVPVILFLCVPLDLVSFLVLPPPVQPPMTSTQLKFARRRFASIMRPSSLRDYTSRILFLLLTLGRMLSSRDPLGLFGESYRFHPPVRTVRHQCLDVALSLAPTARVLATLLRRPYGSFSFGSYETTGTFMSLGALSPAFCRELLPRFIDSSALQRLQLPVGIGDLRGVESRRDEFTTR